MSPADVELAKTLLSVSVELGKMVADLFAGKKPKPKRVREVWATVEQALAKHETDDAANRRWPKS